MKIETSKLPDIISTVMRNVREGGDLFKVDVYVHLLSSLSEYESHYLKTNHSNDLYENDLEYLIETLTAARKMYELEEEYEICQEILTSTGKYIKILENRL